MGKTIKNVGAVLNRQHFSKEFKLEAVRLLELGQKPATQLALELGIPRNRLYKWQKDLNKAGKEQAFPGTGRKPAGKPRGQVYNHPPPHPLPSLTIFPTVVKYTPK